MCNCREVPKNFKCPVVQRLFQWMLNKNVQWYFVRSSNRNYDDCFPYTQRKDMINHTVESLTQQMDDTEIIPEWQRGFIYLWIQNDMYPLDVFTNNTKMKDLRIDDTIVDTNSTPYLQFRFGDDDSILQFLQHADHYVQL